MRETTGIQDRYLIDFLRIEYFDKLVETAHTFAVMDESKDIAKFVKPTVVLKKVFMNKCCMVLEG